MRYLVLLDESECQSKPALERLRALGEGNELVVLSLGALASLALRRLQIPYVTLNNFFQSEKSAAIDKQAVKFCREWYEPVDQSLMSFHGVSLGEILEYDFYYMFIDALRSVEIARTILRESYDTIFVPSLDPSVGLRHLSAHTMCYQTLPPILTALAKKKGMRISRLGSALIGLPDLHQGPWLHGSANLVSTSARFVRANISDLTGSLVRRDSPRIALVGRQDETLIRGLRSVGARVLRTRPSYVHTPASWLHTRAILRLLRREDTIARINDHVEYDGISIWRLMFPVADGAVSRLIPDVFGRIQWTELFVKALRPTCFVVSEDITALPRAMCQVLRTNGVPTIVFQHGILSNDMAGMYLMPIAANCQAVWGEYYKNWHVERGKPPETQVVTGFPRHDELLTLPPLDRARLCGRFGLDPDKGTVLIIADWFQGITSRYTIEQDENYIRLVLRSLKGYDGIQIVVKQHPGLQANYDVVVPQIAEEEGVRVIVAKDSLWDLVRLSSFVIVSTSSVCIEALILGRPVISVNLNDKRDLTGLVKDGLSMGAYSEQGIKASVRICMESGEWDQARVERTRELLFPFIHFADGHASQRVAELVRAKSSKPGPKGA